MTEKIVRLLPNATKILIAIVIMVMSMAAFIASINEASAATLNRSVTVTGESITLGDVFAGVKRNADFVLAPAPMPGNPITWDARTVKRIVKAFSLPYNVSLSDTVYISRLATIVDENMIEGALLEQLSDEITDRNIDLEGQTVISLWITNMMPILLLRMRLIMQREIHFLRISKQQMGKLIILKVLYIKWFPFLF